MDICYAHIRKVELLPSGALAITLTACGECDECRTYVVKYRSRRIVRLIKKQNQSEMKSEVGVKGLSPNAFVLNLQMQSSHNMR